MDSSWADSKSIFITGGTGSFGEAFVKRLLAASKPRRLIVFSRDEVKQSEMASTHGEECMRCFGDVRDVNRLMQATRDVDHVVPVAALKQVPAAEYNPTQTIRTNINGAENLVRVSIENNVKSVVVLSTDKAENPVNLYGATKLASDKLFIAANNIAGKRETRFSVVR